METFFSFQNHENILNNFKKSGQLRAGVVIDSQKSEEIIDFNGSLKKKKKI